jgi:hypothetical protein
VSDTFTCPRCTDTYQAHWHDPDGTKLCRWCADTQAGRCDIPGHPDHDSPCGHAPQKPGDPCCYCGKPLPAEAHCCPDCVLPFEGMTLADIKAVFAADGMFSVGGLGPDGDVTE